MIADPDLVGTAVADLPDDVRRALELAVAGLGYREIARRFGERDEAVVRKLRLGLSSIHRDLGATVAL